MLVVEVILGIGRVGWRRHIPTILQRWDRMLPLVFGSSSSRDGILLRLGMVGGGNGDGNGLRYYCRRWESGIRTVAFVMVLVVRLLPREEEGCCGRWRRRQSTAVFNGFRKQTRIVLLGRQRQSPPRMNTGGILVALRTMLLLMPFFLLLQTGGGSNLWRWRKWRKYSIRFVLVVGREGWYGCCCGWVE